MQRVCEHGYCNVCTWRHTGLCAGRVLGAAADKKLFFCAITTDLARKARKRPLAHHCMAEAWETAACLPCR